MIGVDLDDILVHCVPRLVEFHNVYYGTSLTFEDVHTYDLWEVFGCSREEIYGRIDHFNSTHYSEDLEVVEGAQEAIRTLASMDELAIITARPETTKAKTYDTVSSNFPGIFSEIYFAEDKKTVCDDISAWMMVDDSLHNAMQCSGGRKVFLLDKPWNQNGHVEGINRVYSWDDILRGI